jgi:hypothetical protein
MSISAATIFDPLTTPLSQEGQVSGGDRERYQASVIKIKTKNFMKDVPSYDGKINRIVINSDRTCHLADNFQEGAHRFACPPIKGTPVDHIGANIFYYVKNGKIVHARLQQHYQSYEALVTSPGDNDILMAKPYESDNDTNDDGVRISTMDVLRSVFSDLQ